MARPQVVTRSNTPCRPRVRRRKSCAPLDCVSSGRRAVATGSLESNDYGFGFDAQKSDMGDLVKLGIIDPTKVVRTALQDAASIAGLIITTEATITEHPKKETMPAMPGGGRGGMDY